MSTLLIKNNQSFFSKMKLALKAEKLSEAEIIDLLERSFLSNKVTVVSVRITKWGASFEWLENIGDINMFLKKTGLSRQIKMSSSGWYRKQGYKNGVYCADFVAV